MLMSTLEYSAYAYLTWDVQFNGFDADILGDRHLATEGAIVKLAMGWGRR